MYPLFPVNLFRLISTEPRQKTLDLETACQMLELVLGSRPHVTTFLQFLQVFTQVART